MKPIGNGLVSMVDDKQEEKGFACMKLIKFLFSGGDTYKDWDAWHVAHIAASQGHCPFRSRCDIYKRTMKNHPAMQLTLF